MKFAALCLCTLTLLAGCAAVPVAQQPPPTPTPKPAQPALEKPTYTVQRGTVVDELRLSGHVAAAKQQDLSFTQDGHLKVLYVDRTSVITAGQLLAELDLGDLPNQLRQTEVAYEQAKIALDRDKIQRDIAARRAKLDLEDARARLAELQKPPKPAEITEARAAVQQAQASLEQTRTNASAAKTKAQLALDQAALALTQAQSKYSTAKQQWNYIQETGRDPLQPSTTDSKGKSVPNKLNDAERQQYYDSYVQAEAAMHSAEQSMQQSQVEYDAARQNEGPAIQQAEADVSASQARLDQSLAGSGSAALADARRAITRANLAVEEAQQGGDSELEKRLASAQLEVERLQAQIAAGRLYAPFDGKVASLGARPGDGIEAYKPVIGVMNDATIEVLVDLVSSQDATKLGVGQPVELNFSRYRGVVFTGTIKRLPASATSSGTRVDDDTAYHLSFDTKGQAFDVGDVSEVTVTLARKEGVLWLPPQAVRAFEGRRFVVVKDGDRQRRQDVRVGIVALDRVEILDGLKEGDVVVGQ
ncbi:MAG: HlyD family efflux transporter periplasmic adaptor subunit [Roseiflexaceae bacterium]